jgi:hypothetical protein
MDQTMEPPTRDPNEVPHWLDHPKNVQRLYRGFVAVLALTVLVELLVPMHPHFAVESVFGFNGWFGFGTCVAMIVFAKGLALWLKRPDTYYDSADDGPHDD